MIYNYKKLSKELLFGLKNYLNYFKKNKLNVPLKINKNLNNKNFKKNNPIAYDFLNKYNKIELNPELDDLCRLHYLVRTRKVTTILEFGVGKSTIIFNDALEKNKNDFEFKIKNNKMIRRSNKFECHTVDDQVKWINNVKENYNTKNIKFYKSSVKMTTFMEKKCTLYDKIPLISPDFIYLDGPARFSAKGKERGWTTNFLDGVPMSADILTIEHFLTPGTLIVVDGRTANCRFLKSNLQREWIYYHDENFDQHYFELSEIPLGVYNKEFLNFALGKKYFSRLIVKNKKIRHNYFN
jgi:hypothetical protein